MTPTDFFQVMGSFIKMAETNIVKIGVRDATTAQSTGVVSPIAFKKVICVRNNPNIEATKIFIKSFFSTFALGRESESIQNSKAAPVARKQNKDRGGTIPDKAMLRHATMLNPNIKYAEKADACPHKVDLPSETIIRLSSLKIT